MRSDLEAALALLDAARRGALAAVAANLEELRAGGAEVADLEAAAAALS
jgi:hypothetical protein